MLRTLSAFLVACMLSGCFVPGERGLCQPWSRLYVFTLPEQIHGKTKITYEFFVYPWEEDIDIQIGSYGKPKYPFPIVDVFIDEKYLQNTCDRVYPFDKRVIDLSSGTHTFSLVMDETQHALLKERGDEVLLLVDGYPLDPYFWRYYNRDVPPVKVESLEIKSEPADEKE